MLKPYPAAALFALTLAGLAGPGTAAAQSTPLAVHTVQAMDVGQRASADAVVEAVRDTTVSSPMPGAIVALYVKAGDRVLAGQELARVDARSAVYNAAASAAQVEAALAGMQMAAREFERQRQLYQKQYISQAALDRAQAQLHATQAQVQALKAQAGAALTQSSLHLVKAPYAGVVSEVPMALGDMALPGRALVRLHDPSALRVTAMLAQSAATALAGAQGIEVEIPGVPGARMAVPAAQVQQLPMLDAATHSTPLRIDLPRHMQGVAPGMFARIWWRTGADAQAPQRFQVPASAVVRRAEMTGVYAINPAGRPLLRQVRLGRLSGDSVEVLSGLRVGDQVAADPQAAARQR